MGPWKGSGRKLPFLVLMLTYASVGAPLNKKQARQFSRSCKKVCE
jgi:hypothetical protein